jgi:transcriptional regulator with XRE-family HTH domain
MDNWFMTITQSFGQKVRHFRSLKKLSQEELADLCGLHRTYIGSVERGERNITLINAEKIANALEQSLALFFLEKSSVN